MHRPITHLLGVAALTGAAALATAVPGGAAAAAKAASGSCASQSGGATVRTLAGCTDTADTGGGGVSTVTSESISGSTVTGTSSIAWDTGLTTLQSFTGSIKSGKSDKCTPSTGQTNLYEVKSKGKVTGGTATDLVGGKTSATTCVFQTSGGVVTTNFPGVATKF